MTACLSGAAKLAQRQRGDTKYGPRERVGILEHRAAHSQHDRSAVVIFAHFLFFFSTIITSTERGGKFRLQNTSFVNAKIPHQRYIFYRCKYTPLKMALILKGV